MESKTTEKKHEGQVRNNLNFFFLGTSDNLSYLILETFS